MHYGSHAATHVCVRVFIRWASVGVVAQDARHTPQELTVYVGLNLQLAIFGETSCNNRQEGRTRQESGGCDRGCSASAAHRCQLQLCADLLAAVSVARRCCGQAESGSTLLGVAHPTGGGGLARHLAALVVVPGRAIALHTSRRSRSQSSPPR